jgi:O-antigen ligase
MLFAFGDMVVDGIAERGVYDGDRISVYLLTLRSVLDAPWFGQGYGTFADVFPLYRDRSIGVQGIWEQAHNTYLEIFQGLGLLFGSMLVASVLLLVLRCIKGSITRRQDATVPCVAASAALLVGVHALVDFSLQIQAVTLTFTAILGAGVAQSESSRTALED